MSSAAISSPEWYLNAQDASSDLSRLTIFHYGFKQATNGKLLFAPLDFSSAPRSILDVGTADGLWMREVQSSLPAPPVGEHTFLGTDLNASFFPDQNTPNIKYLKQDIKDPLPSSWNASYDLINMRMILLAAGSGAAQRATVMEHVKLLKPGGWIQIGDCDRVCPDPVETNPHYHEMFACIRAVCEKSGAAPLEAPNMKSWLEEAGLVDVHEEAAMRAVGKTNLDEELGRKGIAADLIIARGFSASAKTLPEPLKPLSDERLDALENNLEKELTEIGAHFPMRFIWGQKSL